MASLYSSLKDLQDYLPVDKLAWVKQQGGHPSFWSYLRYSMQLALEEKEIIFFALLQWAALVGAYLLSIQFLHWMPDAWFTDPNSQFNYESNVVFVIWVVSCVTLAALPIGVLTGAMASSHFLRHHGRESTVPACMGLAMRRMSRLWAFHAVDGAITVWRGLVRLPGKDKSTQNSAAGELAYYGWKVASASALPTLLLATTTDEAMKASARFARDEIVRIAHLRAAYSFVCWVLAIVVGIAMFVFYKASPAQSATPYELFFAGTIPLAIGFGVLMVVLRPIYVLSLCHLYSQHVGKIRSEGSRAA